VNRNMYIRNGELVTILKIKNYFKSLGVRVFLIIVIVGMLPAVALKFWFVADYEDKLYSQRVTRVQTQCLILKNTIASSDYINTNSSVEVTSELSHLTTMFDARVLIVDANYIIRKDTYNITEGKTIFSENAIRAVNGEKIVKTDVDEAFIEILMPINEGEENNITAIIMAVFSTDDIEELVSDMERKSEIMLLILFVLIAAGGILISYRVVRPMNKMQKIIDDKSNGFDEEAQLKYKDSYTELTSLVRAYNDNLERMQELDKSRQEFVSNVAHELKTPMTSIKVLSDSLLCQEDIPAELYKEFLGDIVNEIDRETGIINDLLSMVHLDNNIEKDINVQPKNINDVLQLILKRLRPIAAKQNIELVFESFRPVVADIDEVKFVMAVQNLVENAIKYNILDGWVRVSLNADYKHFFIKVSDSGIGIPEKDLANIFERFYRVDKARSRETGGNGLGLAITKKIIELHRGEIKVYSKEGEGTIFNIRIPLNYQKRK